MYKVIFQGISKGHDRSEVKKRFADLLKLDPSKLNFMDSDRPVILKKGVDKATAMRFKNAIEGIGVLCAIREMQEEIQEPKPERATINSRTNRITHSMIRCPKCGFQQPESSQCSQCGIIIAKYRKKETNRQDLKNIIINILLKYKSRLKKHFYFAPDIPEALLKQVLARYSDDNVLIKKSEVLLLVDNTLLAKDASSNTIFTPTSMISYNGIHIDQIEYIRMKMVADKGLMVSRILQLDKSLISHSGMLTTVKNPQIIISMLKELHQAAKRAADSGTLPRGITEQRFSEKKGKNHKQNRTKLSGKIRFRDLGFGQLLGGVLAGVFAGVISGAALAGICQRLSGNEPAAILVGLFSGLIVFFFVTYKASFFGLKSKNSQTGAQQFDSTKKTQWCDKPIILIFFFLLFFPIAIYGLWRNTRLSSVTKLIILAVFFLFIAAIGLGQKPGRITESKMVDIPNKSSGNEMSLHSSGITPDMKTMVSFNDPNGYYKIMIPSGYELEDKSSQLRSKFIFSYSTDASLAILAHPMQKEWKPEEEMKKRLAAMEPGSIGKFSNAEIIRSGLISIGEANGYELVFELNSHLCHSFSLVSPSNNAVILSISASGKKRRNLHDLLEKAIINNLSL